ncbi:MAG TPA: hypothetical protein DHV79_08925 [Lachnospiraceae bacterium]|nr:hypothetical protein [Lachnospiraceae bacterium]
MTEVELIRKNIERHPYDPQVYRDGVAILYEGIQNGNAGLHAENKELRKEISKVIRMCGNVHELEMLNDTYWKSMLIDAPVDFDSFNLYLERYIPADKKIYQPRRKALMSFVEALQEAHEGKLDFISGSVPKRVGKTTIGTRFVLFREGNSPMSSSLCCGSGDMLVKSFYNGMLEVLQDNEKYAFNEIFPDSPLVRTNADEKLLDLQRKTRFASITCRSIDGSLTGNTEANDGGVLYMDDLVSNEEEAVNRQRLDFLWNKVTGDLFGRWIGGPIVIFGTRYSLYDPIGMFQDYARSRDWRTRIIEIPALNENGESNFEMTVEGKKRFTTKYFLDMKAACTEMQWESQYQQKPFEAKGRLFPKDKLNRFFQLPEREPDAILAVCDTAEKGGDSVCLPIGYVYGQDVMLPDCVFSNATPQHTKPACANKLVKHKVQKARFESNSTGEYYARDVGKLVDDLGGKVSITLKSNQRNKITRIEVESDYILEHFYFLDESLYTPNSDYGMMMKELTSFTRTGKNLHDDAPDGIAQLSDFVRNTVTAKVQAIARPF